MTIGTQRLDHPATTITQRQPPKPNNQQLEKMATRTLRPRAAKAPGESQVITIPTNPLGGIPPLGTTMPTPPDRRLGSYRDAVLSRPSSPANSERNQAPNNGQPLVSNTSNRIGEIRVHSGIRMSSKNVRRTCSSAVSMFGGTIHRLFYVSFMILRAVPPFRYSRSQFPLSANRLGNSRRKSLWELLPCRCVHSPSALF